MNQPPITVLAVGPLQANCYILHDPEQESALIIDPGDEPEAILEALRGARVQRILLTHAHFDHIGALERVRAETGAPVFIHEAESRWLMDPWLNGSAAFGLGQPVICQPADGYLVHGDVLDFAGRRFTVAHTPGHSPGSVSFIADRLVISGDVLFRSSIGRTDLPEGSLPQLLDSIARHLLSLPDDTVVLPGHGPATTVGLERRTNPFLKDLSGPS